MHLVDLTDTGHAIGLRGGGTGHGDGHETKNSRCDRGGGFRPGLAAARTLAKAGARVTLVDHNPYSTFQPLLYQVATAGLSMSAVSYPVRAFAAK